VIDLATRSADSAPVLSFARLANRRAARLSDVPSLPIHSFRDAIARSVAEGWRVVTLFGAPESDTSLRVIVVLADDTRGQLRAATAIVGERYPAIARDCAQAERFEREHLLAMRVKTKVSRLDDARMHRPHRDLVHLIAFERIERVGVASKGSR